MTDLVDQLTPYEHTRRALQRATVRILAAWPHALVDSQARGYGTGKTYDGTPSGTNELTSVEAAANKPDFATAWLAELGDILIGLKIDQPHWQPHTIGLELQHACNELAEDWASDHKTANRLVTRIVNLANKAANYWPTPPSKGKTVDGITIGERGNNIETCGLCTEPVAGGHADPIRRIDGQAFHGKRCWYTVTRQRIA